VKAGWLMGAKAAAELIKMAETAVNFMVAFKLKVVVFLLLRCQNDLFMVSDDACHLAFPCFASGSSFLPTG
jgi:hypothetical protein